MSRNEKKGTQPKKWSGACRTCRTGDDGPALNALNGLVHFLIIGDPRGDNLIVGSISRKLLTELGIRTEDAECKLMGDKCNFVNLVHILKVVWVSTIPRHSIDKPFIKMTNQY